MSDLQQHTRATSVSSDHAEVVVAALMYGVMSVGPTDIRVRSVLSQVQPIFGQDTEFQIYLGIQLDRDPAPLLLDRIWFGEVYDRIEPRPVQTIQAQIDSFSRVMHGRVTRARASRNSSPCTAPLREVLGVEMSEQVRAKQLAPLGFNDLILSDWISSEDRLVTLHVLRKRKEAFTPEDCQLCSLLMRGLAPMIDHHAAQRSPSVISRMSLSQLRLLRAILSGHEASETDTLARVNSLFGVTTQQQLLARFVEPSKIDEIDGTLRLMEIEADE